MTEPEFGGASYCGILQFIQHLIKSNKTAPTDTHYANMAMQYTAIIHGKNGNFQMKKVIMFLLLLKT